MWIDCKRIKSIKKPRQFFSVQRLNFFFIFRPLEFVFLEPFLPQTESVSVPVQYFDDCLCPVAENKKMPGKWIKVEDTLHHYGEAVDGFSHVRIAWSEIDLCFGSERDHDTFSSTRRIFSRVAA